MTSTISYPFNSHKSTRSMTYSLNLSSIHSSVLELLYPSLPCIHISYFAIPSNKTMKFALITFMTIISLFHWMSGSSPSNLITTAQSYSLSFNQLKYAASFKTEPLQDLSESQTAEETPKNKPTLAFY